MTKLCENLALYFYGELDEPAAAQFKRHLAGCAHCQKELLFLQHTQQALVPPTAPQAVVEKVLAPAKKALPGWWRAWRAAVAGVLVLGLGVYYFAAGPRGAALPDDAAELVAYISAEADADYQQFVSDFEVFEQQF